MESLKRTLESIRRMWATLNATQRVIIGAAALLVVVLVVVTSAGTTQPGRVAGEADRTLSSRSSGTQPEARVRGNEISAKGRRRPHSVELAAAPWAANQSPVPRAVRHLRPGGWHEAAPDRPSDPARRDDPQHRIGPERRGRISGSTSYQLGFAGPARRRGHGGLKDGMELTQNVRAIAGSFPAPSTGVEETRFIMDAKSPTRSRHRF